MRRRLPSLGRSTSALLAAGLLVTTLGACSGSGTDDSDSAGASDLESGGSVAAEEPAENSAVDGAQSTARDTAIGSGVLRLDTAQLDIRDIIRTGSISVVADEPTEARDRIVDLVSDLGGYVSDESARVRESDGVDEIRMVIQVPTGRFDDAIHRISTFGNETARTIQAEDVTGVVADIDSRVESARAALDRIRALMDRATTLGTVIRLEGVLSNRQADLEALLAQQSALAGQTELGTLEVNVSGRAATVPAERKDETRGFLEGLQAGWDGLSEAFVIASTGLGAVLPFAVLVALLGIPALVWRRRRVTSQPATPAPGQQ